VADGLEASRQKLDVLLVDYEACRDDDRQQRVQLSALFGVGATLLAGLYVVVLQISPFNSSHSALHLNPVIIFTLPLAPLLLLAYTASFVAGMAMHGYYIRALEREISTLAGSTIDLHGTLPAPVMGHLDVALFRTGPGGPARMRLISNLMALFTIAGLAGGSVLCFLALASWALRLLFILIYVPAASLICWVVWTTGIKPRRFFAGIFDRAAGEFANPLKINEAAVQLEQRRYVSYLLMPRLGELVKTVLYLLLAVLAFMVYSPSSAQLRDTLVYWVAFEILAYQARYAWNDLRGMVPDSLHPARRARGRIPEVGTVLSRTVTVEAMIAVRVGLAIGFLWFLPPGKERWVGGGVLAALALISICYEILREHIHSHRARFLVYTLYATIGFGYGLRGFAGFWYGSGGRASLVLMTVVFIMCSALGAGGVLMLWLYEARALQMDKGSGGFIILGHLAVLLSFFDRSELSRNSDGGAENKISASASLLARRDLPFSPWGICMLVATSMSGVLGFAIWTIRDHRVAPDTSALGLGFLAGVSALLLGYATMRLPLKAAIGIAMAIPTLGFFTLLRYGAMTAAAAILPVVLCLAAYLSVRSGTYEQLVQGILYPLKRASYVLLGAVIGFQRMILGSETMEELAMEHRMRKKQ
jgi:hypothetical protein